MRFIQGIIVGVVLLVGFAYLHDTGVIKFSEDKAPAPFVNWDTVLGSIGR